MPIKQPNTTVTSSEYLRFTKSPSYREYLLKESQLQDVEGVKNQMLELIKDQYEDIS